MSGKIVHAGGLFAIAQRGFVELDDAGFCCHRSSLLVEASFTIACVDLTLSSYLEQESKGQKAAVRNSFVSTFQGVPGTHMKNCTTSGGCPSFKSILQIILNSLEVVWMASP